MKQKKKGVSEMISYVILIAITVGLSVAVYSILQSIKITDPIDCEEGTSLYIAEHVVSSSELILALKNNGRFNVSGIILSISNNSLREPTLNLVPKDLSSATFQVKKENAGIYYFIYPLSPNQEIEVKFTNQDQRLNTIDLNDLKVIQIQPFIIGKKGRIVCKNAIVKVNV